MFALKSRLEVMIRVSMIAVILFNALIPTAALAKSAYDPESKSIAETATLDTNNSTEQNSLLFTPPQISYPDQTSPDPDQPPSPIPSKDQVEFTMVADPTIVPVNGLVRFNIFIRNNSEQELTGLTFTDQLESGLEYSQDSTSPVTYEANKKEVLFSIDHLGIGEERTFTYAATLTSAKRNAVKGKIWLHDAELKSSDNLVHLRATATIGVDVAGSEGQSEMAALQTNGGWNYLGRLKIHMEKDTVGQNALIIASPTPAAPWMVYLATCKRPGSVLVGTWMAWKSFVRSRLAIQAMDTRIALP